MFWGHGLDHAWVDVFLTVNTVPDCKSAEWVSINELMNLPVICCVDPFKPVIPLISRNVRNCPVSSLWGWFSRQVTMPGLA